MNDFFPFIFEIEKKRKECELEPLYIELIPPPPQKKEEKEEDQSAGVIIIEL